MITSADVDFCNEVLLILVCTAMASSIERKLAEYRLQKANLYQEVKLPGNSDGAEAG